MRWKVWGWPIMRTTRFTPSPEASSRASFWPEPSVSYTHLDVYKRQAVLTAGCQYKYGTNPDKENKMSIVTTIFPIADIIRNIGGDYVHVTCLLPPGADPHTFEPTVAQVKAMARTDLFVYIGNGLDDWSLKLSAAADRDLSIVRLSENMELAASPSSPHDHNCKESNNIYLSLIHICFETVTRYTLESGLPLKITPGHTWIHILAPESGAVIIRSGDGEPLP